MTHNYMKELSNNCKCKIARYLGITPYIGYSLKKKWGVVSTQMWVKYRQTQRLGKKLQLKVKVEVGLIF